MKSLKLSTSFLVPKVTYILYNGLEIISALDSP